MTYQIFACSFSSMYHAINSFHRICYPQPKPSRLFPLLMLIDLISVSAIIARMFKSTITILSLFFGLPLTSSHSWIACTDYLGENGEYWDASLCRAFARHGNRYTPRTGQFGQDTGYDLNRPSDTKPCRTQRNDNEAYDSDHQMAVYYPGQKVVIAHPTKV